MNRQVNPDLDVHEIEAVVAAKEGVYDEIPPEINPDGDPLFRVAFRTDRGVLIFWVTSEEYYRLEVGMQGMLKYSQDQIISFGQWIRPFKMQSSTAQE